MILSSKDIVIELATPVDSAVHIDLRDYFDSQHFEIIKVEDSNPAKSELIFISDDKKKLTYHPNPDCKLWNYPPPLGQDTFTYFLRNLDGEAEDVSGTITLTRTEIPESFKAQDIFVHLNAPLPGKIKVDILEFNAHANVSLLNVGEFDPDYVQEVQNARLNGSELEITLNLEKQWDHAHNKTFIPYTLMNTDSGEISSAKIFIGRTDHSFFTPAIKIDLGGTVPADLSIDLDNYAIPLESYLVGIGQANQNAGAAVLIDSGGSDFNGDYDESFGPLDFTIQYTFDNSQQFWDQEGAFDFIRYTVRKGDDYASNYIFIYK